ncbi:MAG: hypothetical protein HN377_01220, partial [Alphaproteobacteria bacterium]|nr:hypothetical protein [Alphaproteobacteria bacterium]
MLNRFLLNRRGAGLAVWAIALIGGFSAVTPATAFEGPLTFNASDFLPNTPLNTANYTIDATARNDGMMNHYTVSSPFGSLEAIGDDVARERAREMNAIAEIRRIKKTEAFMTGFGAAINGPLEASKTLITKPVQTIENLGSTAKEMVGNLMTSIQNFGKKESDDSTAALKDFIGFNKAKRTLAAKLDVDPYSSNPYLQKELGDLAWANFAGGATIDVAISAATVGGVGATVSAINMGAATGGIFLTKSLTSLTTLNTKYLADMGLLDTAADPFLFHAKYPVPHQTLLVLALGAMQDVPGRADFIHLATRATNEVQTRFYQRTAQIMATYHQQARPVRRILVNRGWAFFEDADGRLVLPVPANYMAWTPGAEVMAQAFPAAPNRSMWTTGFVSPMTRTQLTSQGIGIEETIFPRRLADKVA